MEKKNSISIIFYLIQLNSGITRPQSDLNEKI